MSIDLTEDKKAILCIILSDFLDDFECLEHEVGNNECNQKLYGLIKKALEHPETTWKMNQVFCFLMDDFPDANGLRWNKDFFENASKFIYRINDAYNDFVLYETSNNGVKARFIVKKCVRKRPRLLSLDCKPRRCLISKFDVIRLLEAIADINNYDKSKITKLAIGIFKDNDKMNEIFSEVFAKSKKEIKA